MSTYDNREAMADAIGRVSHTGGRTNTSEALRLARQDMFTADNGDRSGKALMCVLSILVLLKPVSDTFNVA